MECMDIYLSIFQLENISYLKDDKFHPLKLHE